MINLITIFISAFLSGIGVGLGLVVFPLFGFAVLLVCDKISTALEEAEVRAKYKKEEESWMFEEQDFEPEEDT